MPNEHFIKKLKYTYKYNTQINNNKPSVHLYFIRHAESTANHAAKDNINEYDSEKWFDAELTNTGIKQATQLQSINTIPDLIYTSPFRRTFATLYHSLNNNDKSIDIPIIVDGRISEMKNGHPCNYNYNNKLPNVFTNVIYSNTMSYEYERPIETQDELIVRGQHWFNDMLNYVKDKPMIYNIFVYSHGLFIYELLNNTMLYKLNKDVLCHDFPKNTQICSIDIRTFI